jgi:hypothetical protein
MSTGQQCCGGAAADSVSEFGLGLKDSEQAAVAKPGVTAADAVYMTATVTAVVLLLISVF